MHCTFAPAFERKGSHFERMKIEGLEKKLKKFFLIEKSDYLCAPNRKRGNKKEKRSLNYCSSESIRIHREKTFIVFTTESLILAQDER
jgi:hypothetical protein